MGKDSAITWTDHTFNPWWGCVKVSPGCDHCYAETLAHRWNYPVWGSRADRRSFGEKHWNQPRNWNRTAEVMGIRYRVFCGSMCDIFEPRPDLDEPRDRLFEVIDATPHLDWLLLTKRIELAPRYLFSHWTTLPANVWVGMSAEDQKRYDQRIDALLGIPCAVRFISAEPLLGPIKMRGRYCDWLIVGGESGPGCRFMPDSWALDLLVQCQSLNIPYFLKQLGGWPDKRDDLAKFPPRLQVQQFPRVNGG